MVGLSQGQHGKATLVEGMQGFISALFLVQEGFSALLDGCELDCLSLPSGEGRRTK